MSERSDAFSTSGADPYVTAPPVDPPVYGGTEPVYGTTGSVLPPITPTTPPPADTSSDDASSTKDVAKQEAAGVAGGAADAGKQVASTAKEQATQVASEAAGQAKQLLSQAGSELSDQASTQQQRIAGGLRALSGELDGLAKGEKPESGVATDLAQQAASRVGDIADWLENRDPRGLLDDVRGFARQRPGAFLAICLGAGVLAGRLTRGLTKSDDSASSPAPQGRPYGASTRQVAVSAPAGLGSTWTPSPTPAATDAALYGAPETLGAVRSDVFPGEHR